MSTSIEDIGRKHTRAEEANTLIESLDETTQKAVYIATKMFLAKKDTQEMDGEKKRGE